MSAIELANYLKKRLQALSMTTTAAAEQSGVSRQTWHKLLRAEIAEAKLSTLIQVAETLETHPMSLLRIYFQGKPAAEHNLLADENTNESNHTVACRFVADITYPDNSLVRPGEVFEKVWEVVNLGTEAWVDWRLQCVDDRLPQASNPAQNTNARFALTPLETSIAIPHTLPGEHARLHVKFRAPEQACTAISHWKSVNAKGEIMFPKLTGLYCMVKVVPA